MSGSGPAAGVHQGPALLSAEWWSDRRLVSTSLAVVALSAVVMAAWLLSQGGASGTRPTTAAERHPAARAVDAVLALRRDRVTDTQRFSPYIGSPGLAAEIAKSSAAATFPPIPLWQAPYVSKAGSSSADVVILWVRDAEHPAFPSSVIFVLKRSEGRWAIVNARDVTGTPPPPAAVRP